MISQVGDQVVTAVVVVVVVMAVAMVRMSVAAVSSGNLFFSCILSLICRKFTYL